VAPKTKDMSETRPHEPQETQNKGKILFCNYHISSIVFNLSFLITFKYFYYNNCWM